VDLKELGLINPNTHWYYVHKTEMLLRLYGRFQKNSQTIIEIGAGSGHFCKTFFKEFGFKAGYCIDPFYSEEQLDVTSEVKFQRFLPDIESDLYLFIDVLEHVDNPTELLEQTSRKAKMNSLFIISVPSFNFLWSGHDVYLEHKKRYTLKELEILVKKANLIILETKYIFAPIFPLVFLARKLKRKKLVSTDMREFNPIVNWILKLLLKSERAVKRNRLLGTSAILIAKKSF
jgi:hypothetical protein